MSLAESLAESLEDLLSAASVVVVPSPAKSQLLAAAAPHLPQPPSPKLEEVSFVPESPNDMSIVGAGSSRRLTSSNVPVAAVSGATESGLSF